MHLINKLAIVFLFFLPDIGLFVRYNFWKQRPFGTYFRSKLCIILFFIFRITYVYIYKWNIYNNCCHRIWCLELVCAGHE